MEEVAFKLGLEAWAGSDRHTRRQPADRLPTCQSLSADGL